MRRVGTLVARGAAPPEVFTAITEDVVRKLSVEYAGLSRYDGDGMVTVVACSDPGGHGLPVGRRWRLGGRNIDTVVFETGRGARLDRHVGACGLVGTPTEDDAVGTAVGAPVVVGGRLWGALAVYAPKGHSLPAATGARLAPFAEILTVAIANIENRAQLARLAEEQAALRRVATLVARGVAPEEVFAAVIEEVGRLLGVNLANLCRSR